MSTIENTQSKLETEMLVPNLLELEMPLTVYLYYRLELNYSLFIQRKYTYMQLNRDRWP